MRKVFTSLVFVAMLLLLSLTACSSRGNPGMEEPSTEELIEAFEKMQLEEAQKRQDIIDQIVAEIQVNIGTEDNTLPTDLIDIQFLKFSLPNGESQFIDQGFRLENITDEPINMRVLAYYNKERDDHIIARGGFITGDSFDNPDEILEIVLGKGHIILNNLTLLYDYSKYSERDMEKILKLASDVFVKVEINSKQYYFNLDMANSKVIF